jgi:hypothetical protein
VFGEALDLENLAVVVIDVSQDGCIQFMLAEPADLGVGRQIEKADFGIRNFFCGIFLDKIPV